MQKLKKSFFIRDDVQAISKELLGKFLITNHNGKKTSGMIVETEAYMGPEDKASHAYNNRRTARTEVMYSSGGVCYVYLCYGMHHLFNIVTNKKDIPHAVLIRAIEPIDGIDTMLKRRNLKKPIKKLTAGPGTLSKALGISTKHNGISLLGKEIWLEDRGILFSNNDIIASPRVGIDYAEEYVKVPWRYRVKNNI